MRQILEPDQSDPYMFEPNFLLHFSELGLQTRFFANEKFIFVWTELTGQKEHLLRRWTRLTEKYPCRPKYSIFLSTEIAKS